MLPDPIKLAEQKTKLDGLIKNTTSVDVSNNAKQALTKLSDPQNLLKSIPRLDKELPIQPDPELLKKQAMAEAQKLRSEAEQFLQQKKEEELAKIQDKVDLVAGLASKALGLYLKMPIIDPKFLAYMAYLKAKQKIRELKQKASKENLKKSKEAFTFPMKPPLKVEITGLPAVEIPKIPEIPKVNLPNLPNLPKLP
jgi:hypothetical protein